MADAMADEQITERLVAHPDWELVDGVLRRDLRFHDFATAFGFMATVAVIAEKMDHHPEWTNVYDRVRIDLTTHDAGGITELDFALAARIDQLA